MMCEKCGTGFNEVPEGSIYDHVNTQNPEGIYIEHGKGDLSIVDSNHPYLDKRQSPVWNPDGTRVSNNSGGEPVGTGFGAGFLDISVMRIILDTIKNKIK